MDPGTTFGPYEITAKLGQGGMGAVYAAHDTRLRRTVALKVLSSALSADSEFRDRLRREAQAAATINHPNICTIHEVGTVGGTEYLALEYLDGQTLETEIRAGRITVDRIIDVALAIADALDAAHQAGIIHRDLKPSNVMTTSRGIPKVLDFGIAARTGNGMATGSIETHLTTPGTILGTPDYMSPEQAAGRAVDGRSDIFSLGAVLYEMATGEPPFGAATPVEVLGALLHRDPAPVAGRRPDLPPGLVHVIDKALRKNPDERYQNMSEVLADLRYLKRMSGSTIALPTRRSARRWVWAGTAVAALTAITLAGFVYRARQQPASGRLANPVVAVLPFANTKPDPEQQYFADGVTESLINALARDGVKVISRTSSMRYRANASPRSIPDIAAELHADLVVEGSVTRLGDRVRLTVEMVDGATDHNVWANTYDRETPDFLSLQADLARAIAHEIRGNVGAPQGKSSPARVNSAALDALLKARFELASGNAGSLERAVRFGSDAVRLQPDFAAAHAVLAEAILDAEDHATIARGRAEAERAIELDDTLSEAHGALAHVLFHENRFADAEPEFQRALELNPSSTTVRAIHAMFFAAQGLHGEAAEEARKARESDPRNLLAWYCSAWVRYFARDAAGSEALSRQAVAIAPADYFQQLMLAQALEIGGKRAGAIEIYRRQTEGDAVMPMFRAWLAYALAANGQADEARRIRDELVQRSKSTFVSGYDLAYIAGALGERDEAFRQLDRAVAEGAEYLSFLNVEPRWDPIRGDPRFAAIVGKIGLTPGR